MTVSRLLGQFFRRWSTNRWHINGISLESLLLDEGLVLTDLLRLGWDVLMIVGAVDDFVVDHVGKVLETVELDLSMSVIDDKRVVAGAAGA